MYVSKKAGSVFNEGLIEFFRTGNFVFDLPIPGNDSDGAHAAHMDASHIVLQAHMHMGIYTSMHTHAMSHAHHMHMHMHTCMYTSMHTHAMPHICTCPHHTQIFM